MQQSLLRLRQFLSSQHALSSPARELLIFAAFLLLTLVMTWPWILHLRDAVSDPGDPYLVSWMLWWDYHQTFTDPINLFHGNILYPYKYSLAFSEHHYGIAVFFFPLFALGVKPLTIHGIATLMGFAFSGYGAYRLVRTLTGSNAAAWISGIAFAFVPYRFGQLAHLDYLSAGWIPIALEALVLFARNTTWKRASWLGVAFFFNALSSIHWFVLTLLPFALTTAVLLTRYSGWRNREFWTRGATALALSGLALLPFFVPYIQVARLYGLIRSPTEATFFSAQLIDWLVIDNTNKFWHGLNASLRSGERQLFPGFLQPLLALAAVLLVSPHDEIPKPRRATRLLLIFLDFILISSPILMVTIAGFGFFKLRVFGHYLFEIRRAGPVIAVFLLALVVRLVIAYPQVLLRPRQRNLFDSLRTHARSEGFLIAVIWIVLGFMGSLGMNFCFHRTLFELLPIFRSIRVPARWSMICYLGLAILAGMGAVQIVNLIRRHWARSVTVPVIVILTIALLIELRAAPLDLMSGQVDPDALSLKLKQTKMAGGIVELPFNEGTQFPVYHQYILRSADHQQPLITAASGFMPPIQVQISSMTLAEPVPNEFFDLLESIPASYVVLHNEFLYADRLRLQQMLRRGVANGRLRFINRYDGRADLFAVIKTEPDARTEGELPDYVIRETDPETVPLDDAQSFVRSQYQEILGRKPDPAGLQFWSEKIQRCGPSLSCANEIRTSVSAAFLLGEEFEQRSVFIYRLYERMLGRQPRYVEFSKDRSALSSEQIETSKDRFVDEWMKRPQIARRYPSSSSNSEFVDELIKNWQPKTERNLSVDRQSRISELDSGLPRTDFVRRMAEEKSPATIENSRAVVLLAYFVYLKRDPTPDEYTMWVEKVEQSADGYQAMIQSFLSSPESSAQKK